GGTYRQITRFIRAMRGLVALRGGNPYAKGRLFTVQGVDLTESKSKGFPNLDAVLLLNAHVYDGPIVPPTPVTPPTTSGGETESTAGSSSWRCSPSNCRSFSVARRPPRRRRPRLRRNRARCRRSRPHRRSRTRRTV